MYYPQEEDIIQLDIVQLGLPLNASISSWNSLSFKKSIMSSLVESFDRSSTDAITKTDEKTSIDSGECSPDGRFSQTERLGQYKS